MPSDETIDATLATATKFATSRVARRIVLLAVLTVLIAAAVEPAAAVRCGPGPEEFCQT